MRIVVTGATGQLGRLVVTELLERGVAPGDVVAAGRSLERVADLVERGVGTAHVDYDDVATLDAALEPGDVVVLVSGTEPGRRVQQHRNVIDAAARAGVDRLVYTSVLHADASELPVAPDHRATEEALRDSGLRVTVLRNGWYTENYVPALEQARATGAVVSSAGDGRVASATRADYAAAAAGAVLADDAAGRVYELSGDEAWGFDDLAAALSRVLGQDVSYRRLSRDEHRELLLGAGLDEGTADFLVSADAAIADGALADTTGDLSRLAGRPSTPLDEALSGGSSGA